MLILILLYYSDRENPDYVTAELAANTIGEMLTDLLNGKIEKYSLHFCHVNVFLIYFICK